MKIKVCSIYIVMVVLIGASVPAQETLVFSSFPETNSITQICQPIMQAAYKKIGIDAIIHYYPPARAIELANAGYTDGELFRSIRIDGKFPNLVMVSVPITHTDIVVFTKDTLFPVQGWESLQPYRIGVERGFKLAEVRTEGMNTYSATVEQTFQMLAAGRVDLVVSTRLGGLNTVKELQLEGIHLLTPPLEQDMIHHFLHKKHQHLVPQVAAILETMTQTGEIDKIRQQIEETILK